MVAKIYWEDAPDWAECVIRTRDDDSRLHWAEPWGTHCGKRQELGCSRRHPADLADTSTPNGWVLVASRPNRNGLPDIGETAFVFDPEGVLMYGAGESGEVVAHIENTAVIRMSYGLGCFTAKHLKTQEQIDQEDHDEGVSVLCSEIQDKYGKKVFDDGEVEIIEWVISLGYRKPE